MENVKVNSVIVHVKSGKKFMVGEILPNRELMLVIELENINPETRTVSEDEMILGHYKLEEAYGVLI